MRRPLSFLFFGLVAFALVASASLIAVAPASAAIAIAPTTTCANSLDNTGGLGLICEVTVVNTITAAGGTATVTVRECHGAAGNPQASCVIQINFLNAPVTKVTQCNGSINGGGGTLLCSVTVTNRFVGMSPPVTAATVNQCVGSVTTGTVRSCDPYPATTTGATITQCNGSGNGGGTSLTCTATGTRSTGLAVRINQCNGSSNGGGTRTVCSARMSNVFVSSTGSVIPTIPNAAMSGERTAPGVTNAWVIVGLLILVLLSLTALRRSAVR